MIVSMLIFFGLSVPVAVSIGLASLAGVGAAGLPWVVVAQQLFAALDKYPLVAIPFFILAGNRWKPAASPNAWWSSPRAWWAASRAAWPAPAC
jgi:TRAP-type mannitol/chloroaromatic compound transport system permease large subunit